MNELQEYELECMRALQKAKQAYSNHLNKKGIDESAYSIRLIVYQNDEEYKPLRKLLELDYRELIK